MTCWQEDARPRVTSNDLPGIVYRVGKLDGHAAREVLETLQHAVLPQPCREQRCERFERPELVPPLNDLYGQQWSQHQNHFRPTFKLLQRQKKAGKTVKIYEKKPRTPYQRLLESEAIPEATKARLRTEHAGPDPFALKKSIEHTLKKFFTALGNLNPESTKS